MKTLICGPYVGEFGWELFFWSGYCRSLSRHFDKTLMITRSGRQFLYEDFATEIKFFDPPSHGTNDCQNNTAISRNDLANEAQKYVIQGEQVVWLPPFENRHGAYQPHWSQPLQIPSLNVAVVPEYIKREKKKRQKILLFHSRNRPDVRPEDNPPIKLFEDLSDEYLSRGYRVISIGTQGDSNHINGTEDMRGIPLSDLAELMDIARCTIGTTSGPLHFATLMGCPVITWQWDIDKMWHRFSSSWNPIGGKLVFINTRKVDGVHIHPTKPSLVFAISKFDNRFFHKQQVDNMEWDQV